MLRAKDEHRILAGMKAILHSVVFVVVCSTVFAQRKEVASAMPSKTTKLASAVYDWERMQPVTVSNGVRRAVFDGPTATLDKINCHITTLNPGEVSGPPRLHLQEEVIIVKEGTIEATYDGHSQTVGPGSVIFFASHATTRLRNPGKVPATYTVIYYYTPKTPRE
jgi:mannose-6-phosphate isomerase-like protein (cupin superfamily)